MIVTWYCWSIDCCCLQTNTSGLWLGITSFPLGVPLIYSRTTNGFYSYVWPPKFGHTLSKMFEIQMCSFDRSIANVQPSHLHLHRHLQYDMHTIQIRRIIVSIWSEIRLATLSLADTRRHAANSITLCSWQGDVSLSPHALSCRSIVQICCPDCYVRLIKRGNSKIWHWVKLQISVFGSEANYFQIRCIEGKWNTSEMASDSAPLVVVVHNCWFIISCNWLR